MQWAAVSKYCFLINVATHIVLFSLKKSAAIIISWTIQGNWFGFVDDPLMIRGALLS